MKQEKLKLLVEVAIKLDRKISEQTAELKEIKAQLATEAESRPEEQTATEGGGWSWMAEDSLGNICRVTRPGDALKPGIDGEGKSIEKIRELAGQHFSRLFLQAPKYKLAAGFREEARALLGAAAAKLIKLCTKTSEIKVGFETKEKTAQG